MPAVGWPVFLVLGALYYAMSYLLIGAAFLGIGAQASTAREVQILSMPITMGQVGLLFLANFAISDPHGALGIAAAAFPLSSPFAMIARAALDEAVLPHLAALAWQGLWVALILKLAAAWFRRSVLNSGGPEGPLVEAKGRGGSRRRPFARTSRGRRGRARLRAYRRRGSRRCRSPPTGEWRALRG